MLLVELKTMKALGEAHRAQCVNVAPGDKALGQPPVIHFISSACIRVHALKSA